MTLRKTILFPTKTHEQWNSGLNTLPIFASETRKNANILTSLKNFHIIIVLFIFIFWETTLLQSVSTESKTKFPAGRWPKSWFQNRHFWQFSWGGGFLSDFYGSITRKNRTMKVRSQISNHRRAPGRVKFYAAVQRAVFSAINRIFLKLATFQWEKYYKMLAFSRFAYKRYLF